MDNVYEIRETVSILFDAPQHLDYHIRSDDYFSFLATAMGVLEDALASCPATEKVALYQKLAHELRHDLRYVQANYTIEPRPLGDVQVIRPSGNLLQD